MPLRTILILAAIGAIILFAALNWTAFTAPTTLHFGVTTLEAPLGLVMLGLTVALAILFLIYVVYLQTTVLVDARRHARELQAQRERADESEASRFAQLRQYLDLELQKDRQQNEQERTEFVHKLDHLNNDLRAAIDHSTNTLAAYVAEVDDLLQRKLGEPKQTK